MVTRPTRRSRKEASDEIAVPLLNSNDEHSKANGSIISGEDIDAHSNTTMHSIPYSDENIRSARTVRFDEHEQIIAPPLRSMIESRETGMPSCTYGLKVSIFLLTFAEFELDSDDLDEENHSLISQFQLESSELHEEQRMPLLIGLADSASRRSSDAFSNGTQPQSNTDGDDSELDALATKRVAGGNMVDSVANMANSILGAG